MKKSLRFLCVLALLAATGCASPGSGRRLDDRAAASVAPSAAAPEVILATPPVQMGALEGILP